MHYNDDSFATMLLMSQINPGREELARPLSAAEWHALRLRVREARMSMGDLVNLDMSGFMMKLSMSEQEAYRLCVLLNRMLPLSMCMEQFAMSYIDIITWNQAVYPARLREKLGAKAPPMIYLAGRSELFKHDAIAILGAQNARGDAEERVRSLTRMAVESGYIIVTDGAAGLSRVAGDEAFKSDGRVIEVRSGGLAARVRERDMLAMIELRVGAAMSITHPDAPHTISHARLRNKCIYALTHAAFIFAAEQGKGATYEGAVEAMQSGWTDYLYVWDTNLYSGNRPLIARGASAVSDITPESFERMERDWRGATARQMCLFDREEPLY